MTTPDGELMLQQRLGEQLESVCLAGESLSSITNRTEMRDA